MCLWKPVTKVRLSNSILYTLHMVKKYYFLKLVLTGAILASFVFLPGSLFANAIQNAAAAIVSPLLRLNTSLIRRFFVADSPDGIEAVIKENQRLRVERFELERIREENEDLRRSLQFAKSERLELIGADVLLYSQEFGREFMVINQGEEIGIAPGDNVVTEDRMFVGVVKDVGADFSKIEVASNPEEKFSVRFLNPATRAVARGLGARTFTVEFITPDALVARGDVLFFTIGRAPDSPLILGTIAREPPQNGAALKEARALLLARPELLLRVFIIKNKK